MKIKELRELSDKELQKRKRELGEESFHLRLAHSGGQLENTSKLRSLRKELARIETLVGERAKQPK